MGRRVFVTVAEVSGDHHAARLIQSLRRLDPSVQIEGLGGPAMKAAGATLHHETVHGAAMGFGGAGRAVEVMRLLHWTRLFFRKHPPDLQICVDSPAMNFHFAKLARSAGVPVLYYVAPQLWAWRERRMKKLRASVDRLACILPFEESYFSGHGVDSTFVGHPLFDDPASDPSSDPRQSDPAHRPVIGLLPGSRRSEALANFPPLLKVARRVRESIPQATFLVPTTPATSDVVKGVIDRDVNAALRDCMTVQVNAFDRLVPRCDLCVTVSGTATLHVAKLGVPMIVVYRASPLLWHGVGRWLMKTRTFALVNLLAGGVTPSRAVGTETHIVPEFIPWLGSIEPVAATVLDFLQHPRKLAEQRERLRALVESLDHPGASDRVAAMALEMMGATAPAGAQGMAPTEPSVAREQV